MKKRIPIASVIVLAAVLGSGAYGLSNLNSPQIPKKAQLVSSIAAEPTTGSSGTLQTSTSQPATTAAATAAPDTTPTNTAPAQTPVAPTYGEDPSNSGKYIVFDRQSILDGANIAKSDQDMANRLITLTGSWTYKDNSNSYQNVCDNSPTMPSTADYKDDPVKQLEWCDSYVKTTYETWTAAMYHYLSYKWF